MNKLAIYYVDPVEGRRRKFVMLRPTDDHVEHYEGLARQRERVRPIGLYGFREEYEDGTYSEPIETAIVHSRGIRTIRVEELPAEAQLELEGTS